jgi:glycine cleavage system H protein
MSDQAVQQPRYPVLNSNLLFTAEGYWIHLDGNVAKVGFTEELTEGDQVHFITLPQLGGGAKGIDVGSFDLLKTSITYHSPLRGDIIEVNHKLEFEVGYVGDQDIDNGWVFKLKVDDPTLAIKSLLTPEQFEESLKGNDFDYD